MRKLVIVGLLAAFTVAAQAELVIATGSKSKTFYKIGSNLQSLIEEPSSILATKGSMDNLEKLDKGEAHVSLAFADAYKRYITLHPDFVNRTSIVGTAGEGCLYVAVNKNGKVNSEDDLQKSDIKVAIGKKGAGANATWDFMGQLDKDYKLPAIEYSGDNIALGKLKSGQLDAVLQMQNPSINNAIVKAVASSNDLEFINVDDYSLNDKLADGQPVYRYKNIDITKGIFNTSKKTICSDTLVIINNQLSDETQESIADAIVNKQSTLLQGTFDK